MGADLILNQYIRKNNYETTNFEDEWIILNTDNFTITRINETGAFCWSLLEKEQSPQSLSQAVAQRYNAEQEIIEKDITSFLQNLVECGLIEHA